MPTAAKLVAAVLFGLTGLLAAEAYKPQMPDSTQFGAFSLIVGVIGAAVGWRVTGRAAGGGWGRALGLGLTSSVMLALVAGLLFSVREMFLRAFQRRYPDPMEALVGVFDIFLHYMALAAVPSLVIVLAAGGVLGGIAAELAARRWM